MLKWIFLVVLLLLLLLGIGLIYRSKIRRKQLYTILLAVVLVAAYLLGAGMLERKVLTFPTVEEAFHYTFDDDILLVVDGKESTMVVSYYEPASGYMGTILPKNGNKWGPTTNFNKENVQSVVLDNKHIDLYRYTGTQDFYVSVATPFGMDQLSDNRGSEFQRITNPLDGRAYPKGYYYAFVESVDKDYMLNIDGEEISFSKVK